jgi:hypothetical protein
LNAIEMCQAPSCANGRSLGAEHGPCRSAHGRRICVECQVRTESALAELIALYDRCLAATAPRGAMMIRRSASDNATKEAISGAAVDVRAAILEVLAAWSGLVCKERKVTPPARDVPALSQFLRRHLEWLARHAAAGDLVSEIGHLARAARRVTDPTPARRLGSCRCPEPDCGGDLVAHLHAGPEGAEIRCTRCGRSWASARWATLARQSGERRVGHA